MYFWDCVNYLEWALYGTAGVFSTPALFMGMMGHSQWECGIIGTFLAWVLLLIYLQRSENFDLKVEKFSIFFFIFENFQIGFRRIIRRDVPSNFENSCSRDLRIFGVIHRIRVDILYSFVWKCKKKYFLSK